MVMGYEIRPGSGEYAEYYARYVALVPEGDIVALLATQLHDTFAMLRELDDTHALYAYAPGKWSIKQVVAHVADAERIFAVRILRFARGDVTPLPAFNENEYARSGEFDARPLASLLAELAAVRGATVALLAGLPKHVWERTGVASGYDVSVRALAWIIAGHELHHRGVLATHYLPAGR
jgi:uncharacterized damage-inducible protein DinB